MFWPGRSQKGRASSGHNQPHVGRGVDYGVRSTMMGVLQIIMNQQAGVEGGGEVYEVLPLLPPPGKAGGDILFLVQKVRKDSLRGFHW